MKIVEEINDKLKDYSEEGELGKGGFGVTYKMRNRLTKVRKYTNI